MNLRNKLVVYLLFTKGIFVIIFLLTAPFLLERINLYQTDLLLIDKREQIIESIMQNGSEALLSYQEIGNEGSFGIFQQEFFQLKKTDSDSLWNFIEITGRYVDDQWVDYRVLNYAFQINGQTYHLQIGTSLEQIFRTERNLIVITLILLTVFVIIAYVFNAITTRWITLPLEEITSKLKHCKSPDLYDHNPVKTSTSDFRFLDHTISEMMYKLEELFAKEREITANISNELLTPISVVQSKLENMINDKNISEAHVIKVSESLRTLNRLKVIVNSLLLIARVENNQFLKNDTFSIQDLLTEVTDEISPIAEEKGLKIISRYHSDYQLTNANRALMFTLLFNILNNAVKHSNQQIGGIVEVACGMESKAFFVTISDHGPGMPDELASEVFKRFRKKGIQDGHGLGLAIAKSIADFHNMEIHLKTHKGEGTTFRISWPVE